jgi:hypothetical protein
MQIKAKLKKITDDKKTHEYVFQLTKYVFLSAFGYIYVFIMMFLLTGLAKVNARISYFVIYLSAYTLDYYLTLKYVFNTKHSIRKITKYIIYLASFFVLGNFLFNIFMELSAQYLVATLIVMCILFPLRFLVNKLIVYK